MKSFYSSYQNYLDSNSCIGNFSYKSKCKDRCIEEGIDEKYINDLATLYMICDVLDEMKIVKGDEYEDIFKDVSEYVEKLAMKVPIENTEYILGKLKDRYTLISHIALYAMYMNAWCLLVRNIDCFEFKENLDYSVMKENY